MDHIDIAQGWYQIAPPSNINSTPAPALLQSTAIVTVPQNGLQDTRTGLVISKIEDTFASMVDILEGGGNSLSIPYRSRNSTQRAHRVLSFPGSSVHEAIKFARMMHIMELAREALVSGCLITKRNIYYQNPDLFKTQGKVDQLVDDLAFTLGVGRDALNIVAASKGLIAGPIRLIMKNNSILSCYSGLDDNNPIPPAAMVRQIDFGETKWILVVEKEATFRTLAASRYWKNCIHGQGIIVTGKGYADLATLEFLNLIHCLRPVLPILCVVDCDPHGIDIMRAYKYGSRSLDHEEHSTVPGLQWLGVRMGDIIGHMQSPRGEGSWQRSVGQPNLSSVGNSNALQRRSQSRPRYSRGATDSLMPLTTSDRKTAQRMLKVMTGGDRELDHEETEQLQELQVMLTLNMKAEIQSIDSMGDLSNWLDGKIGSA